MPDEKTVLTMVDFAVVPRTGALFYIITVAGGISWCSRNDKSIYSLRSARSIEVARTRMRFERMASAVRENDSYRDRSSVVRVSITRHCEAA